MVFVVLSCALDDRFVYDSKTVSKNQLASGVLAELGVQVTNKKSDNPSYLVVPDGRDDASVASHKKAAKDTPVIQLSAFLKKMRKLSKTEQHTKEKNASKKTSKPDRGDNEDDSDKNTEPDVEYKKSKESKKTTKTATNKKQTKEIEETTSKDDKKIVKTTIKKPKEGSKLQTSSVKFEDATMLNSACAVTGIRVSYGNCILEIPAGTTFFMDKSGAILVGWRGSTNPPLNMDGEPLIHVEAEENMTREKKKGAQSSHASKKNIGTGLEKQHSGAGTGGHIDESLMQPDAAKKKSGKKAAGGTTKKKEKPSAQAASEPTLSSKFEGFRVSGHDEESPDVRSKLDRLRLGVIADDALFQFPGLDHSVKGQDIMDALTNNDIYCERVSYSLNQTPAVVAIPDDVFQQYRNPVQICESYDFSDDMIDRLKEKASLFVPFSRIFALFPKKIRVRLLEDDFRLNKSDVHHIAKYMKKHVEKVVVADEDVGTVEWDGERLNASDVTEVLRLNGIECRDSSKDVSNGAVILGKVYDSDVEKNSNYSIFTIEQFLTTQPTHVEQQLRDNFATMAQEVSGFSTHASSSTQHGTSGAKKKNNNQDNQMTIKKSTFGHGEAEEEQDNELKNEQEVEKEANEDAQLEPQTEEEDEEDAPSWANNMVF
jgi:hypothetical protein